MTSTSKSIAGTPVEAVHWVKLGVDIFGAALVTSGMCLADHE